jgi:hypothetical protein
MFSSTLRFGACRVSATAARHFSSSSGGVGGAGTGAGAALPISILALLGIGYVYCDLEDLKAHSKELQVEVSGKTNSAFVFIKPHACKGQAGAVEKVLENKLKESGIRITGRGEISAESIDKNMYIDTHYGAIASKAVKLKPSELSVPDKGKTEFKEAFGDDWDVAVKAEKVFNAKDGAEKLGLDAEGLNKEWSKLKPGKDLIKFGGGFYCGKIKDVYVINGFYMSMRAGTYSVGPSWHGNFGMEHGTSVCCSRSHFFLKQIQPTAIPVK